MNITINDLLEAGSQFGHQTKKWNPKMKKYIFGSRNGIYIIDLQKTLKLLKDATDFLNELSSNGKKVMFVGTKKQAQEIIKSVAEESGAFYMNQRWLGGTLTNYATIQKSLNKMKSYEALFADEEALSKYKKKERLNMSRKLEKLQKYLGGIKDMVELPDAIFIVDPRKDKIALHEAVKMGVPVIAMVDTNCDPDNVSYVIPSNDDAVRSIQTIVGSVGEAIKEGNKVWAKKKAELEKKKEAEKAAKEKKIAAAKKTVKPKEEKPAEAKAEKPKAAEAPKKEVKAKEEKPAEAKEEKKPAKKKAVKKEEKTEDKK